MSDKPDFIDNIDGNTMSIALRRLLSDDTGITAEPSAKVDEARIATAYFSPEGFARIALAIAPIPSIKLLLGTDPIPDNERWQKKLDETADRFVFRRLRESLASHEKALRIERDHIPFKRSSSQAVKQLVSSLRAGNMEVRRYEDNFLHAKAYIFTSTNENNYDEREAVIAGSSNLTAAGLSSNLELNLGSYDAVTVAKATKWFDELWSEAAPFDLAAFFEEIFEPKTPFEIFLRVLWELYGDEIDQDHETDKGLPLTTFQKHGVVRALRLINESGGVIVADEVGLGKTFIAGEILANYQDRRQRALLVCPAALRDTSWKNFISDFELHLEVVSFDQLAGDKQLWDENRRPNAKSSILERNIDEYQLIIIDEAHNYRNPGSPNRADALRTLLYGKRKDVLMLTATPVNNSLWDLYHLIRFFVKQESFLASKGILNIKERFNEAMRINPDNLSPDILYPIVDATTVKRTRQFIKKHYSNDQVEINGVMQPIVFPEPKAITVHYNLDAEIPGLFDLIEMYFDPDNSDCILFARYKSDIYLIDPDPDDIQTSHAVTGLLLSGLLKRFESSIHAFRISINRLVEQHEIFLKALDEGSVVSTKFLKESAGTDDADFDELLEMDEEKADAQLYDQDQLREDVESDLDKLREILLFINQDNINTNSKLRALVEQLEIILAEAKEEASTREDEINKRKVLIFSFFADTVHWIHDFLKLEIAKNLKLSSYKGRFEIMVGRGGGGTSNKSQVAARFAPDTAGKPGDSNETDVLISTDVLAEGVNLQQARHIINYDMPWNPMRLVQRHGRIDRIGSQHNRVFMRTIFPTDRLDALLGLSERISRKIAMAAASVGVVSPISSVESENREFTETKEEIQKLLDEDASLYERGGTKGSTQSGEEYRQTLRKAMQTRREEILQMPWKAGSGMRKGAEQGIFFCAKVGERTYLRFVHTNHDWFSSYKEVKDGTGNLVSVPFIEVELGRCLRLLECGEDEELVLNEATENAAYDSWLLAVDNIYQHWMRETDPVNLQPSIRPLNRKVADFIRAHIAIDIEQTEINNALDILESPWSRRDEGRLRNWFNGEETGVIKSKYLIDKIRRSGLEPFIAPEPLPPIDKEDIKLLTWMAISVT
jgi:SNF2 family DNA or RNA helicase